MRNIKLRVYYWNPNGTNDVEIVNTKTLEVLETLEAALFGVNVSDEWTLMPLKQALKYVAVSPVCDGSETIDILNKYLGDK